MGFLGFEVGFKLGAGHPALADLGLGEQEIDDLVFVQRGAQLGCGHHIVLDILDEPLAILGLILRRRLGDQPVHLGFGHVHPVSRADFAEQQPQSHPAHRDRAVIVGILVDFGQRRDAVVLVAGLVAQLLHDLGIFGLDHRARHLEIMRRSELVEQAALHVGAGQPVQFLLLLVADQVGQLLEAFQPEILGEILVDLGRRCGLDRGHLDVERRRLALQVGGRIIVGEGDVELLFVAQLDALQLLFEPGDQLARPDHHRHVGAGAAVERHAAGLADEINHNLVAFAGLMALLGVLEPLLAGRQLLQLGIDRRGIGLDRQSFEHQPVSRWGSDVGQRLQADANLGVLARGIAFVELDFGLHRRAQFLLAEQLLDAFLDRSAERVGHQLLAVHLADEVGRDLARAEAGHLDLRRDPLDLALDPRLDVPGSDGQRVGALEAAIFRLDRVHPKKSQSGFILDGVRWPGGWCGRRDSNPHILRYLDLNQARLPIPPRPRGRLKGGRPIARIGGGARAVAPIAATRSTGRALNPRTRQHRRPNMGDDDTPQPTTAPSEAPIPGGDIDIPAPQQDTPSDPGQIQG